MSNLPLLMTGVGLAVLGHAWSQHRRAARAALPRPEGPTRLVRYPSVTIVRPVRGTDVGAAENFRAALDTGYPGEVETLFIFDDEEDPALPLARAAVGEHRARGGRGRAEVIIAGPPPPGRTGKLNAMAVGARRARGRLIGFGDSDTRPDRNVLRGVVEALMTTVDAGAAFAPVVVYQPARTSGDALYAFMLNALYSPLAAVAAGPERHLPFIMGQLMVFRREALAAIGGVECADGQLVDDMYLGRRVHEAGYVNVMSRHPLHIANSGMSLAAMIPVVRRWMMFSRGGLPLSFTWHRWLTGIGFFSSIGLVAASFAIGRPAAALMPLLAIGGVGASLLGLQRRYGGPRLPARFAWMAWGVLPIAAGLACANVFWRTVSWRGRTYVTEHAVLREARTGLATSVGDDSFASYPGATHPLGS